MFNELSEKINRIERRLVDIDERMSESYDLSNENSFINVYFFYI
jgi:hypothetical protein